MNIKSSRFADKPVFHTVDPVWGTDNGVTFTFIPENEAEARMFIAGLIPYIRDTLGEGHLQPFTTEAVDRHADSVYDSTTRQISSITDIWIHNSLALNGEFNFTANPNDIFQATSRVEVNEEIPSNFKDSNSISTFRSQQVRFADNEDNLNQNRPQPSDHSAAR